MEKIEKTNSKETNNFKKGKSGIIKYIFIIVISFVIGALIMFFYNKINPNYITKKRVVSENKVMEETMDNAINKIYDAVLCIEVLNDNGNVVSSGTGFVYDKEGYILTNAHVVAGGKKAQGIMSNNKVIGLEVLGSDTYTDLAVLKMDKKDILSIASIGDSKNTNLGNTVFTVGSPLGSKYINTVTKGILSGKDRLVEAGNSNDSYIIKVLQTDAAISPGNSGGPLVNLAGDVIGINSLKLVNDEVEGMGFAIPIEDAMRYVTYLEKSKPIKRPLLGVQILDLTNRYLLYRNGIEVDNNIDEGILLMKVELGSPAQISGLKEGDIITDIDGKKIATVGEFKYELYKHNVGDEIKVTYFRKGKKYDTKVKLNLTK